MSDTDRSGPYAREYVQHPGISGSWHHYGSLEWSDPESLYDDDYARPICPVNECASGDNGHECRTIAERVTTDDGRGAWLCGLHGTFRAFEYPKSEPQKTEQATLVPATDGGNTRSVDTGTDHE